MEKNIYNVRSARAYERPNRIRALGSKGQH